MRINTNEIEKYIGQIIKVFTIKDQRIAAKLVNSNNTYLLLENSTGYRSKILRNEIESLFTISGGE
jgi:hypothetical protein